MSVYLPSFRQTLRRLAVERSFSLAIVSILAIGIGPAAAMLMLFYNVLLRPLDYREPERLGLVRFSMGQLVNHPGLSSAEGIELRGAGLFQSVEVQTRMATVSLTTASGQVPVTQLAVTTGMFPMLGIQPIVGRLFTEADIPTLPPPPVVAPGAPRPPPPPPPLQRVLIDHGAWQTYFGGDPAAIGRIVQIDGGPAEIVGVLPPGFRLTTGRDVPRRIDVYTPFRLMTFRSSWTLPTLVRLAPGTSFEQAQAGLDALASNLFREHPSVYSQQPRFVVTPLLDDLTAATRPALRAAAAAVLLLMVIAFANAAALVVARLRAREAEMAVRTALGATPAALVREVLAESLLLAGAGAAAASVLAIGATAMIREIIPRTVPRWDEIAIDWHVVAYAAIMSLAGLIVFGLIPVWRNTRTSTFNALKGATAQGGMSSGTASRLVLVGLQVALTVVLAFGGVQLVRSAAQLRRVDLGYDPNVLTVRVQYDFRRYNSGEKVGGLFQRIRERVAQVPGVTAAGVISHLPLSGSTLMAGYDTDLSRRELSFDTNANYQAVAPGYFSAMRIPILEGRDFTDEENTDAQPVIIVDEMLARAAFPNDSSAIGKTLRVGWGLQTGRIVGVVGHARTIEVGRAVRPQIYAAIGRLRQNPAMLVVRGNGDPRALAPSVLSAIEEVGPGRAVAVTGMLTDNVAQATGTLTAITGLLTALAGSAAILSAFGLYLVVAFIVHQRRRETAIRTALGATRAQVMWANVRTSAFVLALSIPVGGLLSLAAGRMLAELVYAVQPRDVVSLAVAAGIAALAAALGLLVPARKAASGNLVATLRES
jgi:predicted permease